MRTDSIRPETRKGTLLVGALLQQELPVLVEEENTKRTMQQALVNVFHQMARFLRLQPNVLVLRVDHNALFCATREREIKNTKLEACIVLLNLP